MKRAEGSFHFVAADLGVSSVERIYSAVTSSIPIFEHRRFGVFYILISYFIKVILLR